MISGRHSSAKSDGKASSVFRVYRGLKVGCMCMCMCMYPCLCECAGAHTFVCSIRLRICAREKWHCCSTTCTKHACMMYASMLAHQSTHIRTSPDKKTLVKTDCAHVHQSSMPDTCMNPPLIPVLVSNKSWRTRLFLQVCIHTCIHTVI
jgi:hypothetical protein